MGHYPTHTMTVPISQRFAERMRAPTRNWVRLAWTAPPEHAFGQNRLGDFYATGRGGLFKLSADLNTRAGCSLSDSRNL